MIRRLPRVVPATLLAAGLLGGLSACYVGPVITSCVPKASAGTASDGVTATGTVLSKPDVSFPTPLRPKKTEVSVLQAGEGTPIRGDQYVSGYLTILNGTTGDLLDQSDYSAGTPSSFVIDKLPIAGLKKGLQCAEVGSRVAVVVPGTEAFTDKTRPAGLAKNDSLVVVVDFKDAYLARAQGIAQVAQAGMPSVVLAPNGQPGITIPSADPPKKLQVADLISGSGAKVKSGDAILVQYTGVNWQDDTVTDSTWEAGAPIAVRVSDGTALNLTTGTALAGFAEALKGAQVGDQILAVVPPGKDSGASGGSTVVYVIDVLGILR